MIEQNIVRIKQRISIACSKIGRKPEEIKLIAVTKNRSLEEIEEVIRAGITDLGENKVQEAFLKFDAQRAAQGAQRLKWHMVGHLQTNKAKDAVRIFDLIHSVDSLHLAQEIDKQAAKINKIQDILLEIKTSPEATKFGILPEEAIAIFKEAAQLNNIKVRGLMTIAPLVDCPEKARPYFKVLRELLSELNAGRQTQDAQRILSMGMTDDFEVAIEEGATMVRIGRAIFD